MKWSERTLPLKIAIALLWVVTVVETAAMAAAGGSKFISPESWMGNFESWGYPAWFALVIGGAEFVGALLLLVPRFTTYAAAFLIAIMIGAVGTVIVHDSELGVTAAIANIVLLAIIGAGRWRWRWSGQAASD